MGGGGLAQLKRGEDTRAHHEGAVMAELWSKGCAFHLRASSSLPPGSTVTLLEARALASAASGKGGGFMARSWGDGTPTQGLHEVAFDMYEELCPDLDVTSYRKLPVMSVAPGPNSDKRRDNRKANPTVADIVPGWLDGSVGRLSPMGWGDDTAQVTPKEFVDKMMERVNPPGEEPGLTVVLGKCLGVEYETGGDDGATQIVTGVRYADDAGEERVLAADDVIVAAGPWSCQAEQWFEGAVKLPMEGVKSSSIVWKPPADGQVDATALFCGEDHRFDTHRECPPPLATSSARWMFPGSHFPRVSSWATSCGKWRCTPARTAPSTSAASAAATTSRRPSSRRPPSSLPVRPSPTVSRPLRPRFGSCPTATPRRGSCRKHRPVSDARADDMFSRRGAAPLNICLSAHHCFSAPVSGRHAAVPPGRSSVHGPHPRLVRRVHQRGPQLLGHRVGTRVRPGDGRARAGGELPGRRPGAVRPGTVHGPRAEAGRPRPEAGERERRRAVVTPLCVSPDVGLAG